MENPETAELRKMGISARRANFTGQRGILAAHHPPKQHKPNINKKYIYIDMRLCLILLESIAVRIIYTDAYIIIYIDIVYIHNNYNPPNSFMDCSK